MRRRSFMDCWQCKIASSPKSTGCNEKSSLRPLRLCVKLLLVTHSSKSSANGKKSLLCALCSFAPLR